MARREPARGSWFAALLGLSVLATVAFFVGALVGLVWKEPGLLLAYVRGDTAEIAWTTASTEVVPAGTPPVASQPQSPSEPKPVPAKQTAVAAPPPPKKVAAPKPSPPAVAAPKPSPPAVAAPKPSPPAVAVAQPSLAIQVGAFSERAAADALRVRLGNAGFPAYLATAARDGDHWRVRIGPYAARPEAEKVASRLAKTHALPTWILDENAESQ